MTEPTQIQNITAEGYLPVEGGKIFYRVAGDGPKTPILVLHGGPGFCHDLKAPVSALATDRKIIFYDQLGGGKSDRPEDLSLWTTARFVHELAQVREFLKLDEIILFGSSWGTMLGVDYMLTEPKGVKALILSSPCLSAKMWKADADRLRQQLPKDVQNTLLKHEALGTTQSEEYQTAMWEFLKRFACRIDPIPQFIHDAFATANMEIYNHMWGPSEFFPTGTLKNYDRTNDLHKIKVPTLFICGEFDEATPESTAFYASKIDGAKLEIIKDASHCCLLEKTDDYLRAIKKFLDQTATCS